MLVLYLLLFCASTLAYNTPLSSHDLPYKLEHADYWFEYFIQKHNKVYANEEEKQERFEIFKENLKRINELKMSEKGKRASFGINSLSDWSKEEFQTRYMGLRNIPPSPYPETMIEPNENKTVDVPESFDWRESNVVTPVKNQLNCGTCWTFSTTGTIEGAYAIKHKKLLSFSEQQLADCDTLNNGGCNGGGWPYKALKFLKSSEGIELESNYPYEDKDDTCRYDSSKVAAKVLGEKFIQFGDDAKTKQALIENGPISMTIAADDDWKHYTGGVFECPDVEVDHAVLLVGYGTEKGVPYWLIKNSWGAGWGDKGYMKLKQGNGACGMNRHPGVVPIVA